MGSRAVNLRSLKLEGGGDVKQKNVLAAGGRSRMVLQDIGDVKQKNVLAAGGRSRRVLQDIGNLVDDRALQGKKAVAVGKTIVTRKQKQAEKKQLAPESVIVISSDESSKHKPVCKRATRKEAKAFTSILSARSKAACGLGNKPVAQPENIDAADTDNELAVAEYVDDIYQFYKSTEVDSMVHDYMLMQTDISAKMRSILVDWLIEVHRKFELMPETLYLTINIVDRFLAVKIVRRSELQLVGISSMLIACKYEEIWAPEVKDFVLVSDNAYMSERVLAMEKTILGKLDWYLTVPTPYVFLVRYIKASVPDDKDMENMACFLAELGVVQYPIVTKYSPSVLAASAVYAAGCTLQKQPAWTETLKHYTGFSEAMLQDCAKLLVKFHAAAAAEKLKAVHKKFLSTELGAVSLLCPAKCLLDAEPSST